MIIADVVWGLCSSALAFISFIPYFYKTIKGLNRPHVFSWIIWTLLTAIAFAVQYTGGAGPGAWATGVTFIYCVAVTIASFRYGEKNITRLDWISFIAALLIIPAWRITDNITIAAVLVVIIDGLGYVPTYFKTWRKPSEEMALPHAIANVKHLFSIFAMPVYSVPTTLYPVALLFFNGVLVAIILWRRRVLKNAAS
jgi:hypothetical protein